MTKNILVLAMMVTLVSCTAKSGKKANQASAAPAPAAAQTTYKDNVSLAAGVAPASDRTAPDFSWYDSNGQKISLSSLKGKTVLINFWATWCGPCKEELPDIEAVSKQYASKGLVVIGISEDRGDSLVDMVSSFARQHGLTYQIVIDTNNIADSYGNINAIPTSFIVNKDGKIVEKWVGLRDKKFFESTVRQHLG